MSETSNVDAEPLIRQTVRTSRILAAAMMMGVSTFLVVALFVVQSQGGGRGLDDPPPGQPAEPAEAPRPIEEVPLLPMLAAGLLAALGPLSFFLPNMIRSAGVKQVATGSWKSPPDSAPAMASETGQLLGVWQNGQIIGLALVEGAAFFGLVTYLVTGHWLGLAVGVIGLGLLAAHFPSDDRLRNWLREQLPRLKELRSLM